MTLVLLLIVGWAFYCAHGVREAVRLNARLRAENQALRHGLADLNRELRALHAKVRAECTNVRAIIGAGPFDEGPEVYLDFAKRHGFLS